MQADKLFLDYLNVSVFKIFTSTITDDKDVQNHCACRNCVLFSFVEIILSFC